jgi:hypothetical protein
MRYEFRNESSTLKDTVISRLKHSLWAKSPNYPAYVKWMNYPFSIGISNIHGIGLFTDSSSTFIVNDIIGYAFVKKRNTGNFNLDYLQTNLGSFVNDSENPNVDVELTNQGLVLKAKTTIAPNTEITASYRAIIELFNGDKNVENVLRYW